MLPKKFRYTEKTENNTSTQFTDTKLNHRLTTVNLMLRIWAHYTTETL